MLLYRPLFWVQVALSNKFSYKMLLQRSKSNLQVFVKVRLKIAKELVYKKKEVPRSKIEELLVYAKMKFLI